MYVLRAKAQVDTAGPADRRSARHTGSAIAAGQLVQILGETTNGTCSSVPPLSPAARYRASSRSDWQLADIRAGIPTIVAATTGEFVAADGQPGPAGRHQLHEGLLHRAGDRGPHEVSRPREAPDAALRSARPRRPQPGAALYAERGAVGQVVSSAPTETGSEFLAVVVLDDLPGPFFLDEAQTHPVRRLELPYDVPL